VLLAEEVAADPAFDPETQEVVTGPWTFDVPSLKAIQTRVVAELPENRAIVEQIKVQWAAAPVWVKAQYNAFFESLRGYILDEKKDYALAAIEGADPNEYTTADAGRLTTFNNMKAYFNTKVSLLP